jgi:AcrR family transcriptional regulator
MKHSERSDATQNRLRSVARELFGTRGYVETSVDELVAAAGVTKGAFYHHFPDKEAIFRCVFEDAVRVVAEKVRIGGANATSAFERGRAGCRAFLEASLDPAQQRILLEDAPKVLGWTTMREIEWSHGLALMEALFTEAICEGSLPGRSPIPLAHLFFGALCEAAVYIARAEDPKVALAEMARGMDDILAALLERPVAPKARG